MGDNVRVLITAALVATSAINPPAATANEHSGKWTLNLSKSKYSPGPGPREMSETIELDQHRYRVDASGTAADGQPIHIQFDAKFDGKEYPMIGVPWADTVSVKWTDNHEPQMVQRKRGQVTMTITCKVSADGNTRTCTLKGKDSGGREVDDLVVFDRR